MINRFKKLPATPDNLTDNDYLWSSCGADVFGRVLKVNYDTQPQSIDLIVYQFEDLLDVDFAPNQFRDGVIVHNVPIEFMYHLEGLKDDNFYGGKLTGYGVQLNTAWDGCNRCVASFQLMREPDFARINLDRSWQHVPQAELDRACKAKE